MHPSFSTASRLTQEIISAAIEVHKEIGPGLLESVYEWCLIMELQLRCFEVRSQKKVIVRYKDFEKEEQLKFDVLVENCVLVEVKAVETVHPIHKSQLLSYMRLLDVPLGLVINFNEIKLTDGLSRLILKGADR